MSFPTADQIAIAVITACKLTGDAGPVQVVTGAGGPRARLLAYAGLREAWPTAARDRVAAKIGFQDTSKSTAGQLASVSLASAKASKWWRDELVDEVVGAILADEIEGEAA